MRRTLVASAFAAAVAAQEKGETGPNNSTTPTIKENEITVHIVTVGAVLDAFAPNSIIVRPSLTHATFVDMLMMVAGKSR